MEVHGNRGVERFQAQAEIPLDIGKLINMQRLVLANNMIHSLPSTIGSLRSLKILTLDENRMAILPDELGFLSRLERLSVSGNLLTCLPDTIGKLNNLPQNLLKCCQALQNLSLHGNVITMDQLQQMEGFEEFEQRRRKKFDKQINSNVLMNSKGLDEGLDL
ncbi:hypothetical protein HPP92_027112 [Vanilla planifolia]|uniref:Disease resistance R13L4/SHOC-2-like LRR domain-containing protein n=1 Tax=Vanilla planifolia TaxID=51239 RepID=A0A835PDF7_VANPL|nr:hypothetical protein HPP92_027112 [Vanilla planifolia]